MGSKTIVYIGLLLAMVLLISSQVAARDLAETTNTLDASTETETNEAALKDVKYSGGGGNYGGGYPERGGRSGSPGRGGGGYPRRGGGGRGGCRHGCCGRSYYRGGCRCCTFAGEKADADVQANHN